MNSARLRSSIFGGSAIVALSAFVWFRFGLFLVSLCLALFGAAAIYLAFRSRSAVGISEKCGSSADYCRTQPRSGGVWLAIYSYYGHGLPSYQRVASLLLLLQSVVSSIAIIVFCVVQSAGVDIDLFQMPAVSRLFADVYRIGAADTFAKARFDNLFVPLVLVYAASLPCLAVSIIRNLAPILSDLRRNFRLLLALVFFLGCLWLELFVRVQTRHKDLQQTIIDGGAVGYVILFVVLPMAFAIIAAGLPYRDKKVKTSRMR